MTIDQPAAIVAVFIALSLGGLLKGATGAGAPVVAVPVIAAFFDVRVAVAIMVVPNLITNLWQIRQFRSNRLSGNFAYWFALAGAGGALAGTVLLAWLPVRMLTLLIVIVIFSYVALRLLRSEFTLAMKTARSVVVPTGLIAGILQGATGISAPVSVTFLNAMRLERLPFIYTISVFFAAMSFTQAPALYLYGLLTPVTVAISVVSLVPLFLFMRIGERLAAKMSARTFDLIILILLVILAFRLLYSAYG